MGENGEGPSVAMTSTHSSIVDPSIDDPKAGTESARTVVIALLANLAIAVAKFVVAALTGSSGLLAEAFHSLADSGNEILLLVAQARGNRAPDADHPLGYGREAYFWALIASVAVFVGGGVVSMRDGIGELLDPHAPSSFVAGYVILVISMVLEAVSLRQAFRQLNKEALAFGRTFGDHLFLTSDPTTRAVVAEDAAAIVGDLVALVGLALSEATGSYLPDAVAALVIAVLLGYVAQLLARRNRDFIVGVQAPAETKGWISDLIASQAGVVAINELVVTFIGPRRLWVVSRVDVDDALHGDAVEGLVRVTERVLMEASPFIRRADIVTVGRVPTAG